ncbi:hypothetical protein ACFZAV_07880 [Streptomyces sp. NPDC008343]|uniref:hypothetical protein n=1 Tax=Streptomyces sp. NPDC008343 TaxID=3364828 RepID=UPI0036EBF8D5
MGEEPAPARRRGLDELVSEERQALADGAAGPAPRARHRHTDLPGELTGRLTSVGHRPAVIAAATAWLVAA